MKHYQVLIFLGLLFVGSLCSIKISSAQSIQDSLKNLSDLSPSIPSLPSLPQFHKTPLVSNFSLVAGGAIGYLPLLDSSSLTSGFIKSYFIQSSMEIRGLPFNFSYSSASNIAVSPQTFSYQQFHFSFDPQQLLENLKNEMTGKLMGQLAEQQEKLIAFHFNDSMNLYEKLKDTLADFNYQAHINSLRDSLQLITDKQKGNLPYDTTELVEMEKEVRVYEEYQKILTGLMRFQEKFFELHQQFAKDSARIMENIDKVHQIGNKDQLLQQASSLGIGLGENLAALNFRDASIGTQLFTHSQLTFYNYFSKGITATFNDGRYILKAAALSNNIGFTNPLTTNDSIIFPGNLQKNIFLVAAGIGDLNESYSLVTFSYIHSKDETGLPDINGNKGLVSYLQQISVSENLKLQLEVGKTMMSPKGEEHQSDNLSDIIGKSAAFTSLQYKFSKIKAQSELESSYIGEAYFTEGNPLLRPGTFNVAVGWKQELFHSSLILDYKINHSSFIGLNNGGSRNWYQIVQITYRVGKIGTLSFIISPYQFNYYIPGVNSMSQSHSNFIDLNASLNIPLGKSTLFSNWNFSNYAYQGTFSDTVFSTNTRHLSCTMTTILMKHSISLVGSYFIPDRNENQSFFINSAALTGTFLQNKIISFSIGPKWLGFDSYSDQVGGVASWNFHFAKHFLWGTSLEKFLNIESSKASYPSTILFTTDLTFKL